MRSVGHAAPVCRDSVTALFALVGGEVEWFFRVVRSQKTEHSLLLHTSLLRHDN